MKPGLCNKKQISYKIRIKTVLPNNHRYTKVYEAKYFVVSLYSQILEVTPKRSASKIEGVLLEKFNKKTDNE